jgi:hypothetical protein
MIGAEAVGQQSSSQREDSSMAEAAGEVAAFCFGGLGVPEERWRPALSRAIESMGAERGAAEE